MELFLLLALSFLIIILLIKLNSIGDELDTMKHMLNEMRKVMAKTYLQSTEQAEKIVPKPVEKVPPVVSPPIQVFELKDEPIIEEKIEPIREEVPPAEVFIIMDENSAPEVEPKSELLNPPLNVDKGLHETVQPEKQPLRNESSNTYRKTIYKSSRKETSWWDSFNEKNPDLEKFIGENLINKIGIFILVLGISYFVKYAIDKNWINEIGRVGIGILSGTILLAFAHTLRTQYKAFSSVLVAGAIAVFYFTIAIAFHQFHLFNQTTAFVIMVVITAFSVFISVMYDSKELAILSLIGGFAVPFMVSTGEGNYKVLFTYIAILDIGILVIAYMKRWSIVTIVAFVLTSILFGGWASMTILGNKAEDYPGTFGFATLFYLIFTVAFLINNVRHRSKFDYIELMMIIANTFLYFAIGMNIIIAYYPDYKGLFTISLAAFNLMVTGILYKKIGLDRNVIYLFLGLTLTFVTLTIPIQFEGNYITLFWAAEAVLLLWMSQKSKIIYFRYGSIIVQILMLGSMVKIWIETYSTYDPLAQVFINSGFIGGFFVALSFLLISYLTKKESKVQYLQQHDINPTISSKIYLAISILIFYMTGLLEIIYQSHHFFSSDYTANAFVIVYNMIVCTMLVSNIDNFHNQNARKFGICLAILSIAFYMCYYSYVPYTEIKEHLSELPSLNLPFFLHFVALICVIILGYCIYEDGKKYDSLYLFHTKWFIWVASFAVVFIISNEVLLNGVTLMTETYALNPANTSKSIANEYNRVYQLIVKAFFPVIWGILAFIFLTIGIKRQNRELRIVALVLLAITILKLFIYDISNVSETGKIIAFILLGLLILIMSFAYQRIKKIVLDNNSSETEKK